MKCDQVFLKRRSVLSYQMSLKNKNLSSTQINGILTLGHPSSDTLHNAIKLYNVYGIKNKNKK
jgi:hypothetical protein